MIPSFTIVLGVDAKHLEQLRMVWPTWVRHKPSLMSHPFVVFYDGAEFPDNEPDDYGMTTRDYVWDEIDGILDLDVEPEEMRILPWPPVPVDYGNGTDKWSNPQRHKMLAGFLHVAAQQVATDYWLKLDVDSIATGMDDWIDQEWFDGRPAIIGPSFGYSKPPDQMLKLDAWAEKHNLFSTPPLNLVPEPGASLLRHHRIGGWCNFFRTDFTRECARLARTTGYEYKIPEPSLDGYLFYVSKRMGETIRIIKPKQLGWQSFHTMGNIQEAAGRAMA